MSDGIGDLYAILEKAREGRGRRRGKGLVAAFAGAGGKTTAIFGLAEFAANRGLSVAITTTTRIYDPRDEAGRRFDSLLAAPSLGSSSARAKCGILAELRSMPGRIRVVAAGRDEAQGKLIGIDPVWCRVLAEVFDLVLVEADGSRGLPVKAPASHEPAIPACAAIVFGFMGLDCLGSAASPGTVHRLERFIPITGVAEGADISPIHLGRLAAHPEGLFKSSPPEALRVAVLNRADRVSASLARLALDEVSASGGADRVIVTDLGPAAVPR